MPKTPISSESEKFLFSTLSEIKDTLSRQSELLGKLVVEVASTNTWRKDVDQKDERFVTQTWPAHQKLVDSLEERLRMVEQQKVTQGRLDKMEDTVADRFEKLEEALRTDLTECILRLETSMKEVAARVEGSAEEKIRNAQEKSEGQHTQVKEALKRLQDETRRTAETHKKILDHHQEKLAKVSHSTTMNKAAWHSGTIAALSILHHFLGH